MGRTRSAAIRMLRNLAIMTMLPIRMSMNTPSTVTKATLTEVGILRAGAQKLVRCASEESGIC